MFLFHKIIAVLTTVLSLRSRIHFDSQQGSLAFLRMQETIDKTIGNQEKAFRRLDLSIICRKSLSNTLTRSAAQSEVINTVWDIGSLLEAYRSLI